MNRLVQGAANGATLRQMRSLPSCLLPLLWMLIAFAPCVAGAADAAGDGRSATPAEATREALETGPTPGGEYEFQTLDGQTRSLAHWSGDLVIVNFWATWCPPCVREMPLFQEFHERFSQQGLTIVAVAIDEPDAVREFVTERALHFPILLGLEAGMDAAADLGNTIGALPFTVVIDRQSRIREERLGEVHAEDLENWIGLYLQAE